MSARGMAEAVGARFSRDKGKRTSAHGDPLTSVTEAEETGGLAMRRETRERMLAERDGLAVAGDDRVGAELIAYARGQKVLGKGIHPAAIDRLFELWPEAIVSIRYTDGRYDGVDSKTTICHIVEHGDKQRVPGEVVAYARCRLDVDNFERAHGRRLAFARALKQVQAAVAVAVMEASRV